MEFNLDQEQTLLKDSVRRYLEDNYDFAARKRIIEQEVGFSPAQWRAFADLGLLMAAVPEEMGGLGANAVDTMIIAQEMAAALVLEPYAAVAIHAGRLLIALARTDESGRAARLLAGMATGERLPVFAHGEADAGGEPAYVSSHAAQTDAGWKLTGRKTMVVGAPNATDLMVSARTSGEAGDRGGISLFVVAADTAGLECIPVRLSDGSMAAELVFDGVDLPREVLLGEAGGAYPAIAEAAAWRIVMLCAEAVGAMEKAVFITRDYLKTRHQFGQPIGNFQALQHRMADMLIELELSRSQTYRAMAYLTEPEAARDRAVSSAKVQIGKSAKFVGGQAIQLHGAIGVTEEYMIGHYFKRLTMIDNMFGNVACHLERMAR